MEERKDSRMKAIKATSTERLIRIRQNISRDRFLEKEGAGHMMEPVGEINGVKYVNHSSAVDLDAVWYAMQKIKGPIVWICGGAYRLQDFSILYEIVADKVCSIICLGKPYREFFDLFNASGPQILVNASSMKEAVEHARAIAQPGMVVLLAPGFAGYDMFEGYEDRGQKFKEEVSKQGC